MSKPAWWLPKWTGTLYIGCLVCSTATDSITMRRRVAHDSDTITRDGVMVYVGDIDDKCAECPTLMRFENMARKDPDHDWRYEHYTDMHGEIFQRHGRNEWVLIESNQGWA